MKQTQDDAAAIYTAANKQQKEENDLKRLMDFTATLIFFNQINKRYGNTRIQRLFCQNMTILKVPSHHVIFKKGDEGDGFFLVLEGAVSIINKESNSSFSITKVVEKGLFFGELAIINGKKRSATAQNGANIAYLACIHKNSFRLVFANIFEDVFLHTYFSAIEGCQIFTKWARKDIAAFFSSSFIIEVRYGSVLLRQNEIQADGILIVLSGKIQLFESFNQEEIPLITLSSNDVLNEEQFTDSSSPPLYTSKCISTSAKLLFISNEEFFTKILPDTQIYKMLMNQIVKKQNLLKNRLSEIEQDLADSTPISKICPPPAQIIKKPSGSRAAWTEPSFDHNYDNIIDPQSDFLQDSQIKAAVSSYVSSRVKEAINLVSNEEEYQGNDYRQIDEINYQGPLSPVKMRYMEAIRKKTLESIDPTVVCTMQSRKSLEDYKKILKVKINELDDQQQYFIPSYEQPPLISDSNIKSSLLFKKSLSLEKQQNNQDQFVSNNGFSSPRVQQKQTIGYTIEKTHQKQLRNSEISEVKDRLLFSPNHPQQHINRIGIQPPQIIVDSLNNSTPDDRSRVHNSYLSIVSSNDRQNNIEFLQEEETKQITDQSVKKEQYDTAKEINTCQNNQERQLQESLSCSNQTKLFGQDSILKSLINLEKCSQSVLSQMSIQSSIYLKTSQNQANSEQQQIVQSSENTRQNRNQYEFSNRENDKQNPDSQQINQKLFQMNQTYKKQLPSERATAMKEEQYKYKSNDSLHDDHFNKHNKASINEKNSIKKNDLNFHGPNFLKLKTEENNHKIVQRKIDGFRKSDSGGVMSTAIATHSNIRSQYQNNLKNYSAGIQYGHTAYSSPIQSLPQTSTPTEYSEYFQKPTIGLKKQINPPLNQSQPLSQVLKGGDLKKQNDIPNYLSSSISSLLRPRVRPDCCTVSSVVGVNTMQDEQVDNKTASFFFKKVGSTASVSSTIKKNNYLQTNSHCVSSQNRSPLIRKLSHASQVSSFNHTASNSGNISAQKLRSDENQKQYVHYTVGSHVKRGSVDVNSSNQNILQKNQGQEVRRQSQPDMRNSSAEKELSKSQSAEATNSQTNLISNSKQYKHAQARQRECENIDLAMQLYYKKNQQKKKDLMNSNSLDSSITHPLSLSRPEIITHINNNNNNNLCQAGYQTGLANDNLNSQQTKLQLFQKTNSPGQYDSILSDLLVEDVPLSKQPLLEQLQQNRKNSGVLNIKRIIYNQALSSQEQQPPKSITENNENPVASNKHSSLSQNLAWKIFSKRVAQDD